MSDAGVVVGWAVDEGVADGEVPGLMVGTGDAVGAEETDTAGDGVAVGIAEGEGEGVGVGFGLVRSTQAFNSPL